MQCHPVNPYQYSSNHLILFFLPVFSVHAMTPRDAMSVYILYWKFQTLSNKCVTQSEGFLAFSALTLLVGCQEEHFAHTN